jgi:hypothetical protein
MLAIRPKSPSDSSPSMSASPITDHASSFPTEVGEVGSGASESSRMGTRGGAAIGASASESMSRSEVMSERAEESKSVTGGVIKLADAIKSGRATLGRSR